jgi:hypothetical protein
MLPFRPKRPSGLRKYSEHLMPNHSPKKLSQFKKNRWFLLKASNLIALCSLLPHNLFPWIILPGSNLQCSIPVRAHLFLKCPNNNPPKHSTSLLPEIRFPLLKNLLLNKLFLLPGWANHSLLLLHLK